MKKTASKFDKALRTAQISSMSFGIALVCWSLAPLLVHRLISKAPPTWESFAQNSITLLLGVVFISLCWLMRRCSWALWAAVVLSATLLVTAIGIAVVAKDGAISLFPVILATCTAMTGLLAIFARKVEQPQPQAETDAAPQAT